MSCYACGTPFEADAHWGDCWFAQLHGGFRHEAKQLLTQWADKLTAQQETINAQAARLAAQRPVVDAVLKLSTYSRETVDAGVQRISEALGDYEDWLLAAGAAGAGDATDGA